MCVAAQSHLLINIRIIMICSSENLFACSLMYIATLCFKLNTCIFAIRYFGWLNAIYGLESIFIVVFSLEVYRNFKERNEI